TSTPATYTGVFELIRSLYAQLPTSKLRGYTARRFSFNADGGRCDDCKGSGQKLIEMHFLPDVWVECETCRGERYNPETLEAVYHGKSIADVLRTPCGKALELFRHIPKIRRVLQTLCDVGLDYLKLGQPAQTLSGGEAQRVKLAAELGRPDTGRTLYLLDEPTTGLHFEDLSKLLDVINRLVDLGNTVVVIEHNLDVIKSADWVIEIGPEAGDEGGQIVAFGSPEDVVAHAEFASSHRSRKRKPAAKSKANGHPAPLRGHTGEALAPVLEQGPRAARKVHDIAAEAARQAGDLSIADVGREVKMPWETDGRRWHTQDRVAHNGQPAKWDGELLARVVDRIHELGDEGATGGLFAETSWKERAIVEIAAKTKSHGWFFHAETGREWLTRLKFRVKRNAFKQANLRERIHLPTLDEMIDLPVYGNKPRVKCKNLRGPFQEVKFQVHSLDEIDRPEFWTFLEEAVASFRKTIDLRTQKPEDHMPWKIMGEKWHLSRKGFPLGKRVRWDEGVLESLIALLRRATPDAEFLWTNQKIVHLTPPDSDQPWATLATKQCDAVTLQLSGPKGRFALGRVSELGRSREFVADREDRDVVKLRFAAAKDLNNGDLKDFLQEHLAARLETS
ncbi:MAG: excinuclease ABC subunit A, partial [Planctomycetales bacterium]